MQNLITILLILTIGGVHQKTRAQDMQEVNKNGMKVGWEIIDDQLYVEMSAPTKGWVAIGFNTTSQLKGTSLLMGHVKGANSEVVDFFVRAPGDYEPVTELGGVSVITQSEGKEEGGATHISFHIPLRPNSEFHQQLVVGEMYHLLMAFSLEDDFKHHSVMRTSTTIKL
jgi:hypothetical protein